MKRSSVARKVWIFLALALFIGGCAEAKGGGGDPATPASQSFQPADNAAPPSGYPAGAYPSADAPASASPQAARESVSVQGTSPSGGAPAASPPPPPRAPSPSATSSSRGPGGNATADASSPRKASPSQPAPEPSTRPGLGTEFGEARVSRVHDVSFVRDGARPFAIASLNYNDRRGVDALAASAQRRESTRSIPTGGGAVTISVRDANGDALEAVHVGPRMFVVGQSGQRYSIVLENHTAHRFEAVGTVDGLDVINGKPGTFESRGYVLLPFATLQIEGFRTSTSEVAAFRFAAVADSYAAQTGSARNVGVIGLAFFSERGDAFVPESEVRMRETASPFPADPRFAQPPQR